jgi:drebrin-like protein
MSRVESSSGARYSAHNEQPRKLEPIAPVGTNYTPVGKVDINALRKAPTPAAKPPTPVANTRPAFSAPAFSASSSRPAVSAGSVYGRTVIGGPAPQDAWPEETPTPAPAPPSPPPATSRPPVLPTASRPAASRSAFSAMVRHRRICDILSKRVLCDRGHHLPPLHDSHHLQQWLLRLRLPNRRRKIGLHQ